MAKETYTLDTAIQSLDATGREAAVALHARAVELGLTPRVTRMGEKPDDYKCEYKAGKPARALAILRVSRDKWSVRVKLYHLQHYAEELHALSRTVRDSLLSSAGCGHHAGGCKGPLQFEYAGETYALCRHSLLLRQPDKAEMLEIGRLLEQEKRYSA